MISAKEARKLYQQPPFTINEVERQIAEKAVTGEYTCFEKARLTVEIRRQLTEAGFEVQTGSENFIVRWGS